MDSNQEFHEDMGKYDQNQKQRLSKTGFWQRCPICYGDGIIFPHGLTIATSIKCDTCRGQKIISTITGQPPIA